MGTYGYAAPEYIATGNTINGVNCKSLYLLQATFLSHKLGEDSSKTKMIPLLQLILNDMWQ